MATTKRQEHRTITGEKGQFEVDEIHDPQALSTRAEIVGHVDGKPVNITMRIEFLKTWRFWKWITVTNNLTGVVAHSFWPIPHIPPFLFKWSMDRALSKVAPE